MYRLYFRNPTPNNSFLPALGNCLNFMDITNKGFIPGKNPNEEYMQFWNNLLSEFNLWW